MMRPRSSFRLSLLLLAAAAGCASGGGTYGSGVGDALLERPPYYAGARSTLASGPDARVAVLPFAYQPGEADAALFAPPGGASSQMAHLLVDMSAFLDSITTSGGAMLGRLGDDGTRDTGLLAGAPDVQFACVSQDDFLDEDCEDLGDEALGRGGQRMRLAVERPSAAWVQRIASELASAESEHVLLLTVEVTQLLVRQRGLLGHKSVELGSGHEVPLPWLTSLETPVYALVLTGALVGADGKVVRIGVEGIAVKRTRFAVSVLEAQEVMSDEDIAEARFARRDDLAGTPLAWQVAMREIVRRLTP